MCGSGTGSGSGGGSPPGTNSKETQAIREKLGIKGDKITPREIKDNIKDNTITKNDYKQAREMAENRINDLKDIRRDIYDATNQNPYGNGTSQQYKNYKEAKREIQYLNRIP